MEHLLFQADEYDNLTVHQQKTVDLMLQMDKKLTLIPIIFVFLRIWSTIRFILYFSHSPAVSNIFLLCLHVSIHMPDKYKIEVLKNPKF